MHNSFNFTSGPQLVTPNCLQLHRSTASSGGSFGVGTKSLDKLLLSLSLG